MGVSERQGSSIPKLRVLGLDISETLKFKFLGGYHSGKSQLNSLYSQKESPANLCRLS